MVVPLLNALELNRLSVDQKEREDRSKHLALNGTNVDLGSLTDFLVRYAPLQLLGEKRQTKRLPVGRRILSSCNHMHAASSLVKHAQDKNTELKNVIFADGRSALPHPLWTVEHDAVLIAAIAKHGWVDREKSCRKITSDSEIKWGFPFELSGESAKPKLNDDEWKDLHATATRASFFLEDAEALLDTLKGFNRHLIIESYGLKHDIDGDGGGTGGKWVVDDELLLNASEKTNDNSRASEVVDLPKRKDLAKRAKLVLQKSLNIAETGGRTTTVKNATAGATGKEVLDHGYAVIDQGNHFCILLAEMVRGICKGSLTKAAKQVKLLCSMAYDEAITLKNLFSKHESVDFVQKAEELAKIVNQIHLARQSMKVSTVPGKNLFRVMIGLEPIQPKVATDPIFPSKDYLDRNSAAIAAQQKKEVIRKDDGALGEKAMMRALKRSIEKSHDGVPNVFTQSDDSDDGLQLTMAEAIILLVFCSDGVPLSKSNGSSGNISWKDSCSSVGLCARLFYSTAQEKGEKLKAALTKLDSQGSSVAQSEAAKKVALEIVAEEWKEALAEEAVRHTVDMSPDMLAKKRYGLFLFY